MENKHDFKPFNRYRFNPDYTNIQGKVLLYFLIALVVFAAIYIGSFYI